DSMIFLSLSWAKTQSGLSDIGRAFPDSAWVDTFGLPPLAKYWPKARMEPFGQWPMARKSIPYGRSVSFLAVRKRATLKAKDFKGERTSDACASFAVSYRKEKL